MNDITRRDFIRRMGAAGGARARDLYDERKVVARQLGILGLAGR